MLHIITYATDETKMNYLHCPSIHNICTSKIWTGQYKDKLEAVRNFALSKNPSDIICFVDAYDVICFSDPEEIVEKFKGFNADVVFSAETSCFPWTHVQSLYPTSLSLYKYLNSGGYIGYAWAIQKVLGLDMSQCPCDQGYLTYYYINHIHDENAQFKIELDRRCVLFQTAYGIPWTHFIIENGRLHNQVTHTEPCFIHYNGRQYLMENGDSIMPIVYKFIENGVTHDFREYKQKFPVICDDNGVPLTDVYGSSAGAKFNINMDRTAREYKAQLGQKNVSDYEYSQPLLDPNEKGERDEEIIQLAKEYASQYVVPDQDRIHARDQVNHHAIMKQNKFISKITSKTMHSGFAETNRYVIETYLLRVGSKNNLLLDITLHDYLGIQMNNEKWPHSILGFSTDISDKHNVMLPDLYAMQNYRGMLDHNVTDNLPTLKKTNKLLFIGVSSGKASIEENERIAICRFAREKGDKSWIEAYISSVVNFTAKTAKLFSDYMHAHISIDEQHTYRHIMVIDGNTACWDRLPWVLSSKCICWKLESTDQCWYYPFLKPWVHYIPFTLDTLEETWKKVKDDHELQLRIVASANQFVEDFLRPRCHALYTRTLLDTIQHLYEEKRSI